MADLSLNSRHAFNGEVSDELEVVLVTISHASWAEPVRLSSDPTVLLSDEPLKYGTISNGLTYEFVLMRAIWPDDRDGTLATATLAFENVDADMVKVLRSISTPARIDLAVCLASQPNVIEEEFRGLAGVHGSYDANQISLNVSYDYISNERWPSQSQTQSRFPGLYR